MPRARPERQSQILGIEAGCFTCDGPVPRWNAPNAGAVAAIHARRHGHQTWCEQTLRTVYGTPGMAFDIPLPGLEPAVA